MKHGQDVARCLARAISYPNFLSQLMASPSPNLTPTIERQIIMSTSNQRRRRAQARRNQREQMILAAPSVIVPRKGTVRADGRSFARAARDGQFCPGQAFEQDGKTLGVMDANMREHRSNASHIRPMPNWINRDTERRWKLQQASK